MKHIFVVHSNLTYLSALGVIEFEQIPDEDYLLISQSYSCQAPVPVTKVGLFERNIFRVHRFFNFGYRLDRLLNSFTSGGSFRLYVPALSKLERLAFTHHGCCGLSFFEEGLGSYLRQYPIDNHTYEDRAGSFRPHFSWRYFKEMVTSLANVLRGDTMRLHSLPINYTSYVGTAGTLFYGFNDNVFPIAAASDRRIISMQALSSRFNFAHRIDLSDSYVLIGEGIFSLSKEYNIDQYIDILSTAVVEWLKALNVKRLYIKHHYNESQPSRCRSVAAFIAAGIEVEVIGDDVILELELLKSHNATLIGFSSSLLFYGALMGHHCYSCFDYLGVARFSVPVYWQLVPNIPKN